MSTGTLPTDDRATGTARSRDGTPGGPPSLVAELVFRELVEAEEALTGPEIRERTLLPEREVRDGIAELASRGLCAARRRTTERGPRRYVPTFPTDTGAVSDGDGRTARESR